MPFNSLSFLCFFVLVTIVYYCVAVQSMRNILLLGSSYVFYAYGNRFNLLCLLLITLITWYFTVLLDRKREKVILCTGIGLILLLLLATKYSDFLASQLSLESAYEPKLLNIFILPMGISFYSLQAISLLVDRYQKKYTDQISLKQVSLFLSFFPQAVAGPVHRAGELIPQFQWKNNFSAVNIFLGVKTMLWGYFLKLIVADKISLVVTPVFDSYVKYDGFSLFMATLLYSLEIYFDFWGYSLIAIGVGKVLGYTININFVFPYAARSFRDFWHRWHITLSRWMRDYVYLPLGGRNKRYYILFATSIFVTFLISGIWHGVSFNFILWGIVHAALYLSEDGIQRLLRYRSWTKASEKMRKVLQLLWFPAFFILISFTWLIFRTEQMSDLLNIINRIINVKAWAFQNAQAHYLTIVNLSYLCIVIVAWLFVNTRAVTLFTSQVPANYKGVIRDSIWISTCLILIILLGDIGGQEFLYFNF